VSTDLRYGWYGDDFTGASDTLAVLAQAGLAAMLFMDVPDTARLAAAAKVLGRPLDAVGIAGAARSMSPEAMAIELEPVGAFFSRVAPRVLHYKVCSTFDSAPHVGSIGQAVRSLMPHVEHPVALIVGGQPSLGRHCVFSNVFAAARQGGAVERLDRHPTMRVHPVTPMREADLRVHLAQQDLAPVAGLHFPLYEDEAVLHARFRALAEQGVPAVLLDVAEAAHLRPVGGLLWHEAQQRRVLAVGPSSVAQALLRQWGASTAPRSETPRERDPGAVLVVAGSLSPVTARQVRAAEAFHRIALVPDDLVDGARSAAARQRVAASLAEGRATLVTTAPESPGDADTRRAGEVAGATARFVRQLLVELAGRGRPVRRLGLAGGDTSSLVTQGLGLWGLSYVGALGPGVAISRTHADEPALDGVTLMLKGGQMGAEDVFERFAGLAG